MEETQDTGIEPAEVAEVAEPTPAEPTEVEETETPGEPAAAEPPKPKGVQKRLDELTREKYEARRDAEYWREMAMRQQQQPAQPQPQQPAPVATDTPPKVEDFGDYDEFIRASARFEARQEFKAEQQRIEQARRHQETQAQQRTYQQRVGSVIEKGKTTHPDFDLVAMNPSVPITDYVLAAATESEVGHEILYHLGQNPAEAQRIAALSPYGQAKEIGKIEARLTATPPKAPSKAPPPVVPVGGNAPAGAEPDPAKDPEGWRAYEQERVRKLGRRY